MTGDTTNRAVSPVVGVALLIAIAVILAAVIGAVVLGLGTGGADTPQAQLLADIDTDADNADDAFEMVHNGGEPLDMDEIVFTYGEEEYEADGVDELTAGDSINGEQIERVDNDEDLGDAIGDEDSVEISVVWEDPNSETEYVLETFEN